MLKDKVSLAHYRALPDAQGLGVMQGGSYGKDTETHRCFKTMCAIGEDSAV